MHHSLDMGKYVQVVFGKGPDNQPIPNDANRHTPMWNNFIFFELPYWEVLEVRNAINEKQLTKTFCVNMLGFMGMYGK